MELTTEDRKRIEQEAENFVRLMNWGYHKEAKDDFKKGAEYATLYERQKHKEEIADSEKAISDNYATANLKNVKLQIQLKELEASRAEVRGKVIELQRYHQTLIARYYNETMTVGEHGILNMIINEIEQMLIKWNRQKEV